MTKKNCYKKRKIEKKKVGKIPKCGEANVKKIPNFKFGYFLFILQHTYLPFSPPVKKKILV